MKSPTRHITEHLPHDNSCGYGCAVVDAESCAHHSILPKFSGDRQMCDEANSVGEEHASVVGCNANNANAGRNVNANNACSNANANYAGAFAETNRKKGREILTTRPSRSNKDTIGSLATTGEQGSREYESLLRNLDIDIDKL